MEKPEIIAGLKNAVERGYSLELSIQSFINAGYNKQDVMDSARAINGNIISNLPQQPQSVNQPVIQSNSQQATRLPSIQQTRQKPQIQQPIQQQQQYQQHQPMQKAKSRLGWIILLSGLLVILLGVLFAFLFAKDWVLNLLGF